MATQNICVLLKLLHRLHTANSSSWAVWARAKVSLATLAGDIVGDHWQTLRSLLPIYRAITTSKVQDGRATAFWHDAWHDDDDLATMFPVLASHARTTEVSVREMVEQGIDATLVSRLTNQAQVELSAVRAILAGMVLNEDRDVRESCAADADGNLQTRLLYRAMRSKRGGGQAAMSAWKNRAPPRLQFFGWLMACDKLQSKSNLAWKVVVSDDICEVCRQERETPSHIILHCPPAREFWATIGMGVTADASVRTVFSMERPHGIPAVEYHTFLLLCCWMIWKRRNAQVFRGEAATLQSTLRDCRAEALLWKHRLRREDRWIVDAWCSILMLNT